MNVSTLLPQIKKQKKVMGYGDKISETIKVKKIMAQFLRPHHF